MRVLRNFDKLEETRKNKVPSSRLPLFAIELRFDSIQFDSIRFEERKKSDEKPRVGGPRIDPSCCHVAVGSSFRSWLDEHEADTRARRSRRRKKKQKPRVGVRKAKQRTAEYRGRRMGREGLWVGSR